MRFDEQIGNQALSLENILHWYLVSIFSGMIIIINFIYLFIHNANINYVEFLRKVLSISAPEIIFILIFAHFLISTIVTCLGAIIPKRKQKSFISYRDYLIILEGLQKEHRKYIRREFDQTKDRIRFLISFGASFIANFILFFIAYWINRNITFLIVGSAFLLLFIIFFSLSQSEGRNYDRLLINIKDVTREEPYISQFDE